MESKMYDVSKIILPGKRLDEGDCAHFMECMKTVDISKFNPPSWLLHTETPFKWAQIINTKIMMKNDVDVKLEDYPKKDQDGYYSYEKFCLLLISVFQSTLINDHEITRQTIQKLKEFVEEISKHIADSVYNRIGEAYKHVLSAVTAHVLFLNGDLTEDASKSIGMSLVPFSKMKPEIKAGIQAIKARFYLSCSKDASLPMKYIKEATELDPEYALWIYWTGKIIRKIRRHNKDREPTEELSYFESALQKKKDPKFILFLAQGYREKADYLNHKLKSNGSYNSESAEETGFWSRSLELYRECWDLKKDSAAINRRLGNGVMSLKRPYADYRLAEKALSEALKLSNNPLTLHILGSFYLKHKQDCQTAIEYFIKGAEKGLMHCFTELIRLKLVFDPHYDPYEDLKKMENVMKHTTDLPAVYSDLGWYYLSIEYDLNKAVEYFFKTLEMEDDGYLKNFRSYIFFVTDNVNMYSILLNEVIRLQEENKVESIDHLICKKLLDKIAENPSLVYGDSNIRDSISSVKLSSLRLLRKCRKRFRSNKNDINASPKEDKHSTKNNKGTNNSRAEKFVHNPRGIYNNSSEINWRTEPREIKSFVNNNKNFFYSQKSISEKNKILSWRLECKDN